jgi:hypothetical protein
MILAREKKDIIPTRIQMPKTTIDFFLIGIEVCIQCIPNAPKKTRPKIWTAGYMRSGRNTTTGKRMPIPNKNERRIVFVIV